MSRFTYDSGNNVTEKKRFRIENGRVSNTPYQTDTYDYEAGSGQNGAWKDQLKSYNGQTIEYDGAGNPTNYLGKALTWKGRKLMGIAGLGMEYDYKGYRIKKGNKRYIWQEDRLIAEIEADEGEESFIYYNYDESGVSGMNVNGSEYYYRKKPAGRRNSRLRRQRAHGMPLRLRRMGKASLPSGERNGHIRQRDRSGIRIRRTYRNTQCDPIQIVLLGQ